MANRPLMHQEFVDAPAANTAATITLAASGATFKRVLYAVAFSYDNTPTGGQITITAGGATVYTQYITTSGAGFIPIPPSGWETSNNNEAVVVTLAAGGAGVSGAVSVIATREVADYNTAF
jgi:hypothetical protein